MKKITLLLIVVMLFPICFGLTSCKNDKEELVLNVYNWEEYIADGVIENFEEYYYQKTGEKVKVNYSTFGTCENMYNELKLTQDKSSGNFKYDLVCPSDYMIQRMIEEDLCEEFDWIGSNGQKLTNYEDNTSQYIKDLFNKELQPADTDLANYKLSTYSACYMWGTMGFVYNPDHVSEEDMSTWKGVLNSDYKNRITIKDSVRDSYILAMGIAYEQELNSFKDLYNSNSTEYNDAITNLFNKVDGQTVKDTKSVLKRLKSNLYGFEVDSGKNDMATGKLWINFAWSGDGVYILDVAEDEEGTELNYSVPEEGSNIFFDGWVMPKGANKALAQEFLDYMFQTEIAVENMGYIGYTASTAGLDIFENAIDWYGTYALTEIDFAEYQIAVQDEERTVVELDGTYYEELYVADLIDEFTPTDIDGNFVMDLIYPVYDDEEENIVDFEIPTDGQGNPTTVTIYARDLSYFFGNDQDIIDNYGAPIIYTDTLDRQFSAQYPDYEVVNRCAIMKHLPSDQLEALNEMWSSVKIGYMKPIYMLLIILAVAILIALSIVLVKLIKSGKFGYGKVRNNLKLISKKEIK